VEKRVPEFLEFLTKYFHNTMISLIIWHFLSEPPLSLRFTASAVTLSRLAGGEYLPLPHSKGGAFPSLLTLDGCPTAPANFAQRQRGFPKKSGDCRVIF